MPARFTSTNKALEAGLDKVAPADAIKVIEYWEEQMKDVEGAGAKAVVHDLASLKKHLSADKIDEAGVRKLTHKLGVETAKLGGGDDAVAKHVKELGDKLAHATA